jgi:acylphosphatase
LRTVPCLHFFHHPCILISPIRHSRRVVARVHMIVEGLVQGVGFRWFVARKAETLGIKGWVRNLPIGSVEVEAEAERSMLEELIKEIRIGPRSAQVRNVRLAWMDIHSNQFTRFEIR